MRPLGLLAGAALALALAACARQEPPLTVSEVRVDADLSAIGSREAVAYWQDLSADLETALAAEFVGRIDPGGKTVTVDIDELTLTNAFTSGLVAEDARLAGQVVVTSPQGTTDAAYTVTATASDAMTFFPQGTDVTTIPPTSRAFYDAVVHAFARGTAEVVLQGG